jgi:hypothetical protein
MPYIVQGEPTSWKSENYKDDFPEYKAKYPEGLDLKPGSDDHDRIRSMIWQKTIEARNSIQKRFDNWREIDRTLTTYVSMSEVDKKVKDKDEAKPVAIVFPYSYSMLESLLTYLCMAFFQDPIFPYEGVEDDDTIGAMLLELVVRLHCIKNKVALNLHTVFRDSLAYGISAAVPGWTRRWGRKPIVSESITGSPLGIQNNRTIVSSEKQILFEGNSLYNIDPYMLLLDPSVSSSDVQRGEFFGWVDRDNYMNLLSQEAEKDSKYFNVKYLKAKTDKRSTLALDTSDRDKRTGSDKESDRVSMQSNHPADTIKMYITLIPKDHKLSLSEYPEKWYFELASDDVVIRCEQADYNHGLYPVGISSPEFDGYSSSPIGRMEVLYGLQHTLDFLFNSHITNVRKAINDMLIVDPYLVNIQDLKDPQPGKLIRLRRPAWGRGVDKVVQQLAVQDITRANIQDSAYITQWMDRIVGADQSMAGALRQGGPERLTSAEFQGTRGSAMSRLQRTAMIIGMQFMQDISEMFAVHTQQFMQQDTYVKIIGKHIEKLEAIFGKGNVPSGSKKVSVFDLAINYDIIPRDGSIPGGNFNQAWLEMFKTLGQSPELASQFDMVRIFMYIAQQTGAKNVEDFRRTVAQTPTQVMPDQQVMDQVQRGNMIPTSQLGAQ